jgi:hypothetical protein
MPDRRHARHAAWLHLSCSGPYMMCMWLPSSCRLYDGYVDDYEDDNFDLEEEEQLLADFEAEDEQAAAQGQAKQSGAGGSQSVAQAGTQSATVATSTVSQSAQQQQQQAGAGAGGGASQGGTVSAPPTASQPSTVPQSSHRSNVSWIGTRMPETPQEHCELASGSWCGPYYAQVRLPCGDREAWCQMFSAMPASAVCMSA